MLFAQGGLDDSAGAYGLENLLVDRVEGALGSQWAVSAGSADLSGAGLPQELDSLEQKYKSDISFRAADNTFLLVTLKGAAAPKARIELRLKKPVRIAGVVKTVSFYLSTSITAGINCSLIVADINGIEYKIPAGGAAQAFQRFAVMIPPTLSQSSIFNTEGSGISFLGFEFNFSAGANKGATVGIDLVTAESDMFMLHSKDSDAMDDNW
jgi:hypothetical protein